MLDATEAMLIIFPDFLSNICNDKKMYKLMELRGDE